ncbi:MAG TPA: hypothetical protein PK294_12480 [Ignavibacteria bacterium]|nr:hypothetical protein [Ignavibacteria bacterium]HQY53267.1 hypothetical protein [Ignavibacteria bacterium]HRB01243.1 hypothetical protein [Ignavibacteria bacterium]
MKKLILLFLFILISTYASSQTLEENLQQVGPNYGKLYLQPLVDAMGTDVNSNFFYTAYVPYDSKKPVQFNIGLRFRAMNTFLSSVDQVFDYTYSDTLTVNGVRYSGAYSVENAPTVIGNKTEAVAKFTSNGVYYPEFDLELIGGIINTTLVPLVIPEITFGTVYGTDASIILLPTIDLNDLGKFRMFGFTLRHNFSHYVKDSPVDYSIMVGYQRMSLTENNNNDLWKSKSFFINGQLSKTFGGIFTPYMAIQYEQFKADISYIFNNFGQVFPVSFSVDGATKFRGVLGATVKAGFFAFNVDANLGEKFALSCAFNFIIM